MPIKGLSDTRRLPRLGKIRLGEKKQSQSGKEYPSATDHFVVPPKVAAKHGEAPKELPIIFPVEQEPEQWYRAYSLSRGLICKGDGETAVALVDLDTGLIAAADAKNVAKKEVPCDPDNCPLFQSKRCRPIMNLQFIIPDIEELGIWQLDTSSINSIININSSIALVRAAVGRFSNVPAMKLVVEPMQVTPEGKAKTVYVLQLKLMKSFEELMRFRGAPALPEGTQHFLPDVEDDKAPDDLYPHGVIDDTKTDAPSQSGLGETHEEKKPEPEQRKPRRQRTSAKVEEPKPLVEPVHDPEIRDDESIEDMATRLFGGDEPKEEKSPEPPEHDAIVALGATVDDRYYEDVLKPMEEEGKTYAQIVEYLESPAPTSHVQTLVASLRNLHGLDDAGIRDFTQNAIGRAPKMPFSVKELSMMTRASAKKISETKQEPEKKNDDVLGEFEE